MHCISRRRAFLGSSGTARPYDALLAGEGRALRRETLQAAFHIILLKQLLIHDLMVLRRERDGGGLEKGNVAVYNFETCL